MAYDRQVRRAAVLGAGVMGAQIAAHLTSAGVETLLYELPAEGKNANAHVLAAIKALGKIKKPAPVATPEILAAIQPANYQDDLSRLADCDLIIEAVAERLDIKAKLYSQVEPYLQKNTIFASNTSGLSIESLAQQLPAEKRRQFCGVHFFNPPRHMHLVEIIPSQDTEPKLLDKLETFLTSTLGKGVVRAKDRPNFVGNRLGVFNIQATMYHAKQFGLAFDTVDALTGKAIGRASSATFKTCDLVGLDTLAHVLQNTSDNLSQDPWASHYGVPDWLQTLVDKGALGNKTKAGIYRRQQQQKQVYQPDQDDYRPVSADLDNEVKKILALPNWADKVAQLRQCDHPQAQFLWNLLRDGWHYAAVVLADIADNARDADLAIRWGFGWKQGPFEMWQAAGWRVVADWIAQDIRDGRAMSDIPLPEWVTAITAVHKEQGSWSPDERSYRPRSALPVYRRQYQPEPLLGEASQVLGNTLFETPAVRCWHNDHDVAIISFKTKMNCISEGVLDGIHKALDLAEQQFQGLVIWQPKAPFSVGADLAGMAPLVMQERYDAIGDMVARFQETMLRLRYSLVPTVAATQGYTFGGGCEITMHCDHVVSALETYIGLVEIGVGLLPAGGGCKEWARRIARDTPDNNPTAMLTLALTNVLQARVATSALEAKQWRILDQNSALVFHPGELLSAAIAQAKALSASQYRPPLPGAIKVTGQTGIANAEMAMANFLEGHYMSDHDYFIGQKIAHAICGGPVAPGSEVPESWLLKLEREAFVELVAHPKSQQRAMHMLQTGKPLRN